MKGQFGQDLDYWIHKTKAFLHDPPDKAINIPGHEERANDLLAAIGLSGSSLDKDEYQRADIIASGMDRATLPGYAKSDPKLNGAIDFCTQPKITHPTGNNTALEIKLPTSCNSGQQLVGQIAKEMAELLKNDLGDKAGSGVGLSEQKGYQGEEEQFAPARFHYLYFILRRRLAQQNIGGLGGLWHRLPADTRLPDHSIWQHNGLVSALASSTRLSPNNTASLMVFAITPVQDFVGRARKLRDYWSGSIILSWLAFEGIKAVIHHLGADHIVYPSLHGQPLIDGLLESWKMEKEWLGATTSTASGVASFPNKFVCLVPSGRESEIAAIIEQKISDAWQELGEATLNLLEKKILKKNDPNIREQFSRQLADYWDYQWAAVPLINRKDHKAVEELINKKSIDDIFRFVDESNTLLHKKGVIRNPSSGEGQLYSITHRLAQAMLAAGKAHRTNKRQTEEGIKCDMFGEFEILHYHDADDRNPKPSQDPFWQDVRANWPAKSDFGPTERLCAIAMLKRLAYRVCENIEDHPLRMMFKNAEVFPSTTELAMYDWWQQVQTAASDQDAADKAQKLAGLLACFDWSKNKSKVGAKLAQWYHAKDEPAASKKQPDVGKEQQAARSIFDLHKVKDIHKYYAVLLMDGDKMGELINGETLDNGETLGASWNNVLHPDLMERLNGDFDKDYKAFWRLWQNKKRFISPAVHAAISEALGDFSLLTVPRIIDKHHGRLLYAGGDDVCAILPVSTAIDAAREIAESYNNGFIFEPVKGFASPLASTWEPEIGKLGLHLGTGDKISISAGIMIAHHKKPLGSVIKRAHELLNMAKNDGGRNAFVLELDKRSGGGRLFGAKWHDCQGESTILEHFLATASALKNSEQAAMSSSLAYRLSAFETGLQALMDKSPEQLVPFIAQQLDRSRLNNNLSKQQRKEQLHTIASHVAALISNTPCNTNSERTKLPLESIIVANFIGHCRNQTEAHSD